MDKEAEQQRSDNFLGFCRNMMQFTNFDYSTCERFLSGGLYDTDGSQSQFGGVPGDIDIMIVLPNCCAVSADTHSLHRAVYPYLESVPPAYTAATRDFRQRKMVSS